MHAVSIHLVIGGDTVPPGVGSGVVIDVEVVGDPV